MMAVHCNLSEPNPTDLTEGDLWFNTTKNQYYMWLFKSWCEAPIASKHLATQWNRSRVLFNLLNKKSAEKIRRSRKKMCIGNVSFPVKEFTYNWYYD